MRRLNIRRYLSGERTLCLSFVGQQTVEHMDLFPVQTSSCTFPCQEREKREWGAVGGESILYSNPRYNHSHSPAEIQGAICWFLLVGLVPGLPWPSSRCGKWSVNSLQICCGWGGPRALAGRNVTWTPLQKEAALWDGAFMHILSGPIRKLTQQLKGEPAGENACWRQWSCRWGDTGLYIMPSWRVWIGLKHACAAWCNYPSYRATIFNS